MFVLIIIPILVSPFDPWLASNFSLQYHQWITHLCQENKRNDYQLKKLLIAERILLVSTLGNVSTTVGRIRTLMWGCKMVRNKLYTSCLCDIKSRLPCGCLNRRFWTVSSKRDQYWVKAKGLTLIIIHLLWVITDSTSTGNFGIFAN